MEEKELLKIIEEAAKDGRTELHLSDKGIKSLHVKIGELTNLTTLYLHENQLKSIPKELGQLTNLTELYLSDNKLTSVPKEIGKLINLTEFYLTRNQLTSLPKELGQLTNLKVIELNHNELESALKELGQLKNLIIFNLENNQLTSVPEELSYLKNLTNLNLSRNRLTSVPKELGQLKNLTKFDLSQNQLTSIPKELGQLENLKRLSLYYNPLTNIPAELVQLKNLRELNLPANLLTSVPKELGQLRNLTEINLSDNQLKSVPKELGQLINLKKLSLQRNRLSSIPKELGQLKNLTSLNLYRNQLTRVPKELGQLKNLTELDLGGNHLKSVPEELGQLTNLTKLKLENGQLTSVPGELGQLKNLTEISLRNNKLTSIPKELGQLINLTKLDLYGNELTSVPEELGQLTNLTGLYLQNNQFTSVPKELRQLKKLTEISLIGNQLTSVPKELGQLKNLTMLRLEENQLSSLPKEIVNWGMEIKWEQKLFEYGIFLEGNPLESPPIEIVKQGTEAVREYFKSLEVEKRALNEVKVLLVGNGGAGKTSLVKRLTKNIFNENEPKTHGVNIDDWQIEIEGETIKAHLWDYGGQGIMQATHRVFFSIRSIYILVLNAREEPDPEDWLMNIKSLGGQSPVIVVINKTDVHDYRLNEKYLLKKYPTIKGFNHISCKTGEGIEVFFEELKEKLSKVEMTKMEWGKDWLAVKEKLENLGEDYISYEEYEEICRGQNVREEGQQKTLIEFLHDLGVVLHFKEFSLEHMKILNPEWITEGIYKIINSKALKDKKGVLNKRSLSFILNKEKFEGDDYEKGLKRTKYTRQEQIYVIDLMREFELCYEPYGGDGVFVPDLFKEKEPEFDFDYENCIRFYFEYEYLPGPVMPRFIVQRHRDIEGELRWRTGVVLKDEKLKSRALVRADKRQRIIYIYVSGKQKRDYFAVIRKTILDINNSFQELNINEWIPLPDQETMAVEYAELIGYYLAGEENILVGKLGRKYSVMKLLDGIESRRETQVNINKIIASDEASIEVLSRKIEETSNITQKRVIGRVDSLEEELIRDLGVIITELVELRELAQREFLSLFNRDQRLSESHCPNVFAVLPKDGRSWLKNLLGQKMVLQLYCQEPGQWHPAVEGVKGGRYEIKKPSEFFDGMGPYILKLAKVIKYAAPVAGAAVGAYAGPVGAVMGAKYAKDLAGQIKLMEELAKKLAERDYIEAELLERTPRQRNREAHTGDKLWVGGKAERIEGMELRMFRQLLDEVDEQHEWGGLKKVLTPEGHYLWLCEEHAEKYRK